MSELVRKSDFQVVKPETTNTSNYLALKTMQEEGYNPIRRAIETLNKMEETNDPEYLPTVLKGHLDLAKFYSATPKQQIDMNVQQQHQIIVQPMNYANTQGVPVCSPRIVDVRPKVIELDVNE